MALTRAVRGEPVASATYNELVDLFNGTTGAGKQILPYDYNSSSTYSAIIGNQDTTNGYALKVQYGAIGSPTTIAEFRKQGIIGKLKDKSGFEFNLEAYTADGTAINDGAGDTDVAWTAALAAAAAVNGTVIVGPGTFLAPTSAVTMPSNVVIKGAGRKATTIKHRADSLRQAINFNGKSNAWLMDCTVDGNASANDGTTGSNGGFVSDSEVVFQGGTDCGAVNVLVQNFNSYGFLANGVRTSFINCHAVGQGLAFSSYVSPTHISDYPVHTTLVTGKLGGVYGFASASGDTVTDLYFEGCTAHDMRSAGFLPGGDNILMVGCHGWNNHGGYWPDAGAGHVQSGGPQCGIQHLASASNGVTILGCNFGVSTAGSPANCLELGDSTNVLVDNCQMRVTAASGGLRGGGGITLLSGAARVVISNCHISVPSGANGGEGLQIPSGVTGGVTVDNCTFKDLTIVGAITIAGTADNVTLTNNRFTGNTAGNLTDSTTPTSARHYWGNIAHTGTAIPNTVTGAARFASSVYVGDTSNADVTLGLTLNQGAADDQILAFKSSDVAHGMTTLVETDTYGRFQKVNAASGGVALAGYDGTATIAMTISAICGAASSTRSTAGVAPLVIDGFLKSGTSAGSVGGDKNLLAIRDSGSTQFIVDSDGDVFANATGGAVNEGHGYSIYDEFDDVQLVRALDVERGGRGLIETEFDQILRYNRADLEALGIVQFNDHEGGDGSVFVNYSALTRLHSGALWQQHQRLATLETSVVTRLERLEALALPPGQ